MRKKILSTLLAAIMMLAMIIAVNVQDVQASEVSVANENQLRNAVNTAMLGGRTPTTIILTTDIELSQTFIIPSGADITLRSSGTSEFSLIAINSGEIVSIERDAFLTIDNIGIRQQESRIVEIVGMQLEFENEGLGVVNNGGTFTMKHCE